MINPQINTGITQEKPIGAKNFPGTILLQKVKNAVPPRLKAVLVKFYSNKKVFLPIAISTGLIIFVIILGLLFGNRDGSTNEVKTSGFPAPTTPMVQNTAIPEKTDRLYEIKKILEGMDIEQSRLRPPVLDYKISF